MSVQTIKILLADDHRLVRDGIRALLKGIEGVEVIGDVSNADELLQMLKNLQMQNQVPNVLVLDVSMPSPQSKISSGLEAAAIVKKDYPEVKILFLSMHEEAEYIISAMKAGALGYVLKSAEQEELVRAIRTVAAGQRFVGNQATERIMESLGADTLRKEKVVATANIRLTHREHEVLQMVAEGHSTKMIAEQLIISPRTVETHRNNIMNKLQVANTAELVRLALQYGLLEQE